MVFFLGNRDLGNAPRFINSQGPNLQVSRLGPPAQPDHQRSSPQCGVSSARIQKQPTTVLGDPNCRPFPIASSEPRISESAIAVPSFTTPSPSPSPGPRRLEPPIYYEVPPPPDYQAPPPYSRSLVTETLVYEYRTSERHPEAGSYRYDVPGEQRHPQHR
ncbi:hypothetical protein E2P81_ATG05988 [Venturia nashicola]|nr:hypothetical protein E2P81_ATG05988 [Venturia nashicola]